MQEIKSMIDFYLVNYLEVGKNWEDISRESDGEDIISSTTESGVESERDFQEPWDDWEEDEGDTKCLFCNTTSRTADDSLQHCKIQHDFDFDSLKDEWELDFYSCVKMINYIRTKIQKNECPRCPASFHAPQTLFDHLKQENHFGIDRSSSFWKDPIYLHSALASDPLLTAFSNFSDDEQESESKDVIAELYLEDQNVSITPEIIAQLRLS